MRSIKRIHEARFAPIADLITYTPLPSNMLEQVDPFIFLNHHGPQVYSPNNNGLPFGPHPHRGMETVTFILEGDISHKDSGGHESIISAGGVQWMSAGKGLIHAEVSSDQFKKEGGDLEILQLWLNMPARLKMSAPQYKGFQKDKIPALYFDDEKVTVNVVSGYFDGKAGAFQTETDVHLQTIYFKPQGELQMEIPEEESILCYLISGEINVNGEVIREKHLVEFNHEGSSLQLQAIENSVLLFGHAKPLNEPMVARGPFVMNTEEEIQQAYNDYQRGVFGSWSE